MTVIYKWVLGFMLAMRNSGFSLKKKKEKRQKKFYPEHKIILKLKKFL